MAFARPMMQRLFARFSRVTRRECYGRQRPWRVFLCECGELSCHTDPVLKRNVRAYSKFVRRMHGVGLVDYSVHCECEFGVLFVHKKSGKIWLITD